MEKEVHRTKDVEIIKNVPFSDMMLSKSVLAGLKTCNFEFPSPIQLRAIPIGRCGSGTTKLEKKTFDVFRISNNNHHLILCRLNNQIEIGHRQNISFLYNNFGKI